MKNQNFFVEDEVGLEFSTCNIKIRQSSKHERTINYLIMISLIKIASKTHTEKEGVSNPRRLPIDPPSLDAVA